MANNLNTNPIFLDTFSSDVTVTTSRSRIIAVTFRSGTASDRLTLEDENGVNIIDLSIPLSATGGTTGQTSIWFGYPGFPCSALTCDVSDGVYAATARAYIYLA